MFITTILFITCFYRCRIQNFQTNALIVLGNTVVCMIFKNMTILINTCGYENVTIFSVQATLLAHARFGVGWAVGTPASIVWLATGSPSSAYSDAE